MLSSTNDPSSNYSTPGGAGLNCAPMLSDLAAEQQTPAEPKSTVELGPNAQANAAADNYFELNALANPSAYMAQLQNFWAANLGSWAAHGNA
jgi:hypothetical protein